MVDLDEPWFQRAVKHYVEAQNLKTKLIFNVIRLTRSVEVCKTWLPRNQRLYYYIFDFILSFLHLF
jgi:hypothetical protein